MPDHAPILPCIGVGEGNRTPEILLGRQTLDQREEHPHVALPCRAQPDQTSPRLAKPMTCRDWSADDGNRTRCHLIENQEAHQLPSSA